MLALTSWKSRGLLVNPVSERIIGDLGKKNLWKAMVMGHTIWATTPDKKNRSIPGFVKRGERSRFKTDDCTACAGRILRATPAAAWVWSHDDQGAQILQRIDPGMREVTLELRFEDLYQQAQAMAND